MISKEQFKSSIAKQFGGGNPSRFPRQHEDQLVFLGAVTLHLSQHSLGQEKAVNDTLKNWLRDRGAERSIDHVTLRRYLVDFGFLQRDSAGSLYHVNNSEFGRLIDSRVHDLDLGKIIEQAQVEREAKKRKWRSSRSQ